jgi:hypothetical protein
MTIGIRVKRCGNTAASTLSLGQNLDLYYSYDTIIGFRNGNSVVVMRNYWGPTTGRHINAIDPDVSHRVSEDEFEKKLSYALASRGVPAELIVERRN